MFTRNITFAELLVLTIFASSFFVQIFYQLFFYLRVARYKEKNSISKKEKLPISVIICARNEAKNLKQFLPKILEQDYPNFEVVVVNDRSEDNSEFVLSEFQKKYSNLYVTKIPKSINTSFNKKLALVIGLKAAKNDHVLLTDADCYPFDNQWINSIQSRFSSETDFVIGYGAYAKRKGFLNRIIRYDTFTIAVQYLGFALAKIPYMGVGRNMAYRKSAFFNTNGFSSHLHLASGDDDLFVNEHANKDNLNVAINGSAVTISLAETSIRQWFKQKKRHFTTGKYYKKKHKYLLGLEIVSRFIFYLLLSCSFLFPNIFAAFLGAFLLRYFLQTGILYFSAVKLHEKSVFYLNILFDILIPILNLMVFISSIRIFKRRKTYK